MDLLARYLQAIGQYLPPETKDDVLAELRANLWEQMDARSEELGRPLTDADLGDIFRAHGKPEVVALRYLPQRSLIGPTVFPFYTFTLARVLPWAILIGFLVNGIQFAVSRHKNLVDSLVDLALGLCSTLLLTSAVVTAIFATIEWAVAGKKWDVDWTKWDPAKLPALQSHPFVASPRSTMKRVIELVFHCLWMAYVLWIPSHPFWIVGPGIVYLDSLNVALAPIWQPLYRLLIVVLAIQLALKVLALLPRFERWAAPGKLGTDFLSLIAGGMLAASSTYFVAAGPAADLVKIAVVNHFMAMAFRVVFVFVLAGFAKDAWNYTKRWAPKQSLVF